MQLLLRHNWPGNAEQLWQVLKQVVQRRRAGVIMPKDLPPECWTVSRRLLSPLESIERDAIVQSLQDHDGNKVRAAEALGMSRATIYRKIHEYGIVAVRQLNPAKTGPLVQSENTCVLFRAYGCIKPANAGRRSL